MKTGNHKNTFKSVAGFIFWLGICYFTAWIGAQVSPGIASSVWYDSIQKPDWNPPAWVFGPVWTILYTMMGVAVWLVWKNYRFTKGKAALSAFLIQLFLNGLWSHIFFGLQEPGWAFLEIILLLTAIIITTILFFEKNRVAGWLMIPYILWVSFATVLNGAIWWLN